jgi:hypothetical protein
MDCFEVAKKDYVLDATLGAPPAENKIVAAKNSISHIVMNTL